MNGKYQSTTVPPTNLKIGDAPPLTKAPKTPATAAADTSNTSVAAVSLPSQYLGPPTPLAPYPHGYPTYGTPYMPYGAPSYPLPVTPYQGYHHPRYEHEDHLSPYHGAYRRHERYSVPDAPSSDPIDENPSIFPLTIDWLKQLDNRQFVQSHGEPRLAKM